MDKTNTKKESLADEYEAMKIERQPYLEKAKIAAQYTIPSLINDDSISNLKNLPTPNQSVGADGINNLSSKVTMTMLPPNQTFFKFSMDESFIKDKEDSDTYRQEINKGLSKIEKMLSDYQEQLGDRVCLGEAQKHLYVGGNVFLVHDAKEGLKYYPLSRYCVKRDYCGNVLKAITKETVGLATLPEDTQNLILEKLSSKEDKSKLEEQDFDLYTAFKRKEKYWEIYQECEGVEIPNSRGKYPIDICPFMALRYVRIDGESYGRGLIEEYIGDLSYLDVLSLAIKQASLAGSKLVMLVNPNGLTKIKHLAEAKNGGFALGRAEDVQPLQANKYYDLQVAQSECDKIERRLNRIFVMKAAIQRNAERVTAEEIKTMVQDLEEALGNHYSIMCKEFQLAYVKITYFHMKQNRKNLIPDLIRDENIRLTLTTGLEALGRSSDLNKLITFLDIMGKIAPAIQHLGGKVEKIAQDVALSLNLDIEGMFYTEQEKSIQNQERQKLSLIEKVAPNAVNKYGEILLNEKKEK